MSYDDLLEWADNERKYRREHPELYAPKCPICKAVMPASCTPEHHTLACPTRWYRCEPDESAGMADAR